MKAIYKYVIPDSLVVRMEKGAVIIHLGLQLGRIHMWARVDPGADEEIRNFLVLGTGDSVDDAAVHIGTVFHGQYVWHVFEVHA